MIDDNQNTDFNQRSCCLLSHCERCRNRFTLYTLLFAFRNRTRWYGNFRFSPLCEEVNMMKTFLIEFDYEKCHCECYVQKLSSRSEPVYILNFRDTFLIRKFNGKKILLTGKTASAGTLNDIIFEQSAWEAIEQKEKVKSRRS